MGLVISRLGWGVWGEEGGGARGQGGKGVGAMGQVGRGKGPGGRGRRGRIRSFTPRRRKYGFVEGSRFLKQGFGPYPREESAVAFCIGGVSFFIRYFASVQRLKIVISLSVSRRGVILESNRTGACFFFIIACVG